ncbi:hypothetical protein OG218_02205 [Kineococcus sp. NBC_00420]|uniref:hypothetical protein n=1 Tax=Kineococcus sp. NBC_00420 TaxID=2903564 RepID=UPI002E1BF331
MAVAVIGSHCCAGVHNHTGKPMSPNAPDASFGTICVAGGSIDNRATASAATSAGLIAFGAAPSTAGTHGKPVKKSVPSSAIKHVYLGTVEHSRRLTDCPTARGIVGHLRHLTTQHRLRLRPTTATTR